MPAGCDRLRVKHRQGRGQGEGTQKGARAHTHTHTQGECWRCSHFAPKGPAEDLLVGAEGTDGRMPPNVWGRLTR